MGMLDNALLLALVTAGLAVFVRALPWPKAWLAVKPLGCPTCVSGWSAFAVLGGTWFIGDVPYSFWHAVLAWFICVGVAAPIVRHVHPPEIDLPLP